MLFRNDPPLELQGIPGVNNSGSGEIGYITFGVCAATIVGRVLIHRSPVPPPFNKAKARGGYFAYPDLPRLFPLPHQGFQSIHPLEDAEADGRLPSRYAGYILYDVSETNRSPVLRRARPEAEEKERKTASGRTFRVQS